MTPTADNPLRKAAVFVRSLPAEAAAAVLGRLSVGEAASLRAAIKRLGDVNDDERASVADDVLRHRAPSGTSDNSEGVELSLGAAAFSASTAPASPPPSPAPLALTTPAPPAPSGQAWLASLHDADPAAIAAYLTNEQPQATAVVLGYLPAELAARVLQGLPEAERGRVVARLAQQGEADPESLRVITAGLSEWIGRRREETDRRTTRLDSIRLILASTPSAQRAGLVAGLAAADPEAAAQLTRELTPPTQPEPAATPRAAAAVPRDQAAPAPRVAPLPLEALERLDGRALAEAVGALDARTALLALAAAPAAVLKRLTDGLPRGAASDLRARLLHVGPATLAEIDRAQHSLCVAATSVAVSRQTPARA